MKHFFKHIMCACMLTAFSTAARADVVEYTFDITTSTVNFTGTPVTALTVGGGIPAPLIEAQVGDTLRVTFNNKMNVDSSIHWHGILLPNDQDGVPYLTTQPIRAGESFTFEYPVIHAGTYWYHSHTGLQEQRGVYGPIIFRKPEEPAGKDKAIVLSDWTNENPRQVLANLKKDGDYYALKKGSVQSWDKVIAHGWPAIKNRLQGALTRMGPMDISDVGYDAFLANGKQESMMAAAPMQRIKLRIVNAAASSYFDLEYAGGPMTIVAADGMDVDPVEVKRLKIAIAETYDVIITAPHHGASEFRATSEDGTGYSSVFIGGDGERFAAPDIPRPNPFLMDHSSHNMASEHMQADHGHNTMDHAAMGHTMPDTAADTENGTLIPYMTDYEALRAPEETSLPMGREWQDITLTLTGNMERYVWGFDGKTLRESDKILIKKGENVRFILKNETMMHHPVHLHGHFFRVINKQGAFSPLKHTVNVPPMAEVIIEFAADEEKDWFFHCHNLYHMKSGMSRVVSYGSDAKFNPNLLNNISSDPWFNKGHIRATNNMLDAGFELMNTRSAIGAQMDYGFDKKGFEATAAYTRHMNRFLSVSGGIRLERHEAGETTETEAVIRLQYVLPLLIEAELEFDTAGNLRGGLESELQLTSRLRFDWEWEHHFKDSENEYRLSLGYEISKKWLLTAVHDSDHGSGIGLHYKF